MRQQLLITSILAALLVNNVAVADEVAATATAPAAAPASPWTITTNFNLTSDYYARGVSQSWHQPAVQGGIDIVHSSGFYAGVFGSTVSERTYVGGNTEIDLYGGYNGTFSDIKDLGYTVGAIGYFYPNAGWSRYKALTDTVGRSVDENFNTVEANVGLSYKWVSAKVSYGLTNWYGAQKSTGWTGDSDGSLYYELNALVPLPVWGLNLIGHIGRADIKGELSRDPAFAGANANANGNIVATKASITDYKIGLSKTFAIANAEGFNASLVYVGGNNGGSNGYWGQNGYGGASFTTTPGSKDLSEGRFVLTVGRSF